MLALHSLLYADARSDGIHIHRTSVGKPWLMPDQQTQKDVVRVGEYESFTTGESLMLTITTSFSIKSYFLYPCQS